MDIKEFIPYLKNIISPFNSEADHSYALAGASILKKRRAVSRKIRHHAPLLLSPIIGLATTKHLKRLPQSISSHQPQDSSNIRAHSNAVMKHFHFETGGSNFGKNLAVHLSRRKSFISDSITPASHSHSISRSPAEKMINSSLADDVIKIPIASPSTINGVKDVHFRKKLAASVSEARIELFILDAFFYELHHDDQFHLLNPELFTHHSVGNVATSKQIFSCIS